MPSCPDCARLRLKTAELREDRNEWRAMYIELIALLYALGLRNTTRRAEVEIGRRVRPTDS